MAQALALPLSRPVPRLQRAAARAVGNPLFWVLLVSLSFGLPLVRSIRRELPPPPPVLATLPAFRLVDPQGRAVTPETLRGRIVIAELASDDGVSPLNALQKRVRNTADAVVLLSLVAAEESEARQVAVRIAAAVHPGAGRWTIAAGDTRPIVDALGKALGYAPERKLLLLDRDLKLRRCVDPTPSDIDLLMRDIGLLANAT